MGKQNRGVPFRAREMRKEIVVKKKKGSKSGAMRGPYKSGGEPGGRTKKVALHTLKLMGGRRT